MPKAKTTSDTVKKSPKTASQAAPTHDQIATRAYQIYQERGNAPGDPMQDWLQAELELNAAVKPKKASSKTKVVSISAA